MLEKQIASFIFLIGLQAIRNPQLPQSRILAKVPMTWGEALRRAINKGLVNSRYAIVVLSKAFLAERKWTEHELNGLFAREKVGNFIILPIWHGIGHGDILQYDPALADRLAKVSDTDGYPDIVKSALKVLGRSVPELSVGEMANPPSLSASGTKDDRELVAYAWYEQKGPGAEMAQIYIRKSNFIRGGYVFTARTTLGLSQRKMAKKLCIDPGTGKSLEIIGRVLQSREGSN